MNATDQLCDLHGPYSADQAAAIVTGTWQPQPTGHICERCSVMVKSNAQALADRIDADAIRSSYEQYT